MVSVLGKPPGIETKPRNSFCALTIAQVQRLSKGTRGGAPKASRSKNPQQKTRSAEVRRRMSRKMKPKCLYRLTSKKCQTHQNPLQCQVWRPIKGSGPRSCNCIQGNGVRSIRDSISFQNLCLSCGTIARMFPLRIWCQRKRNGDCPCAEPQELSKTTLVMLASPNTPISAAAWTSEDGLLSSCRPLGATFGWCG